MALGREEGKEDKKGKEINERGMKTDCCSRTGRFITNCRHCMRSLRREKEAKNQESKYTTSHGNISAESCSKEQNQFSDFIVYLYLIICLMGLRIDYIFHYRISLIQLTN